MAMARLCAQRAHVALRNPSISRSRRAVVCRSAPKVPYTELKEVALEAAQAGAKVLQICQ